jgi:phage terminase large subunit-like protein
MPPLGHEGLMAPPKWRAYAAGSEVAHFAKFCREHLIQSEDRWEGRPLLLEPWQRRMLGEALAFDVEGWPTWRSVVIIAPRKNGKTQTLAALSLYRLLTSAGRPEILLAAPSDKVAGRLFDACTRFVRRSPELSRLLRVRDHAGEIVREDGMGIIYRLSSDPSRLYGYNPTHVVADELAQWATPNLRRAYAALTSGGGARSAPQVFTITTAAEASQRHDSILGRILDAGLEADDVEREPGLTVCRLPEARTLVYEYAAPTVDPMDVKAMKLANPASWITEAYLRRQAEDPELTDAQVMQLHGCVWAASASTFVAPDAWSARVHRNRVLVDGERLVLGFDGSYRRDATAVVACTLDGFVTPIAVWERPDGASTEWKVPRDEVADAIADAMERFEVLELACDPPGWNSELDAWREAYGDVVVDFPTNQRQRMAPACDRFRVGVLEGDLSHDGNPILARHLGHCVAKDTPYGQVVTKDGADSPRKIDTAVAAIVAYDRAMWHAANTVAREPFFSFA